MPKQPASKYQAFAEGIRQLEHALDLLEPMGVSIGGESPRDQEWFELLKKKLVPQLDETPHLVVGVVGGTNIGKSVVFNHLAGQAASAASPLAAGTKHPVCLVPPGADHREVLDRIFEPFTLCPWQSADDPLGESPDDMLYWRVGGDLPDRLLLLDTPDVDSDAQVNWRRARAIRQVADVLIAVLTQQKYNDAAVKQFFRSAVEADKPIIVVFNQCHLEADAEYWPQWLATFCGETGAAPELVYVVPHDRPAAENLSLPFYDIGKDGKRDVADASSLREDLASLHFDTIKVRTFRGALLRVLDGNEGAEGYLQRLGRVSAEFAAAAEALSASEMARVAWPSLPAGVLVDEIRQWWDTTRKPWSRRVHGFYRTLGQGMSWPVRSAWQAISGPAENPLDAFQNLEREAIVLAVEKMLDELSRLAQVGSETLRPRLTALLGGDARATLLQRVQTAHEHLPAMNDDYRDFLKVELNQWKDANPKAVRFLQSLDHAWAIARPTITVALVVSSWGVAGGLVGSAGHAAGELATEAAITGGIAGGGEALVSTTSEGMRQAAARLFVRLQSQYAQQRADWLAGWLEDELLGDLLQELRFGAEVCRAQPYHEAASAVSQLTALVDSTRGNRD